MDKPLIADNKPIAVDLSAGEEYHLCTCGRSARQPFCDGSLTGTAFTPRAFTADSDGEAWLCRCKQSASAPYCDGSHKRFTDEQVGAEGDDLQILVAQMARKPLLEDVDVGTELVIGPEAKKPLTLSMPLRQGAGPGGGRHCRRQQRHAGYRLRGSADV